MRRAVVLLRSIIPTDPAQLLFLCGSIFLLIAHQLRWWPAGVSPMVRHVGPVSLYGFDDAIARSIYFWIPLTWWCGVLLFIGGTAGLYFCLWPGSRPVRRILVFVCLPGFWAVSVICGRLLYLARDPAFPLLDASRVGGARCAQCSGDTVATRPRVALQHSRIAAGLDLPLADGIWHSLSSALAFGVGGSVFR
jgi:hypothetical protein